MTDLNTVERFMNNGIRVDKIMSNGTKAWSDQKNPVDPSMTHSWWGEFLSDRTIYLDTAGRGDTVFDWQTGLPQLVNGDIHLTTATDSEESYLLWVTGYANPEITFTFIYPSPFGSYLEIMNCQTSDSTVVYRVYFNDVGQVYVSDKDWVTLWTSSGTPLVEGNKYKIKARLASDGNLHFEVMNPDGSNDGIVTTSVFCGINDTVRHHVGMMWNPAALTFKILGLSLSSP